MGCCWSDTRSEPEPQVEMKSYTPADTPTPARGWRSRQISQQANRMDSSPSLSQQNQNLVQQVQRLENESKEREEQIHFLENKLREIEGAGKVRGQRLLPGREQLKENKFDSGEHQSRPNRQQWPEPEMKMREKERQSYEDEMAWTQAENKRLEAEIQLERRRVHDAIAAESTRLAQEAQSYKRGLREEMKVLLASESRSDKQRLQEMEGQIAHLQRELKNSRQNPRNRHEEEKKRYEHERAQMQRQIGDLQRELKNIQQDLRNSRDRHEELKRENNNLKSKNQDLLTRISSMASERMRSNNPCVEDLSDPNRHSAVLAKWQALMNGEYWTLYEVALKKLPDEKNTAQFLLRIMELGFKEAQYMQNGSKAFMDLMQSQRQALGDPSMAALLDLLMKNENFQQIVDSESRKVRKGGNATLPASAFQDLHKKIQKDMRNTASDLLEKSHKFADEVLRLCFLMALQWPPMALVFDRPEDKEMDALLYEPDGDRNRPRPCIVNFVLTPPLLRYEGGPVLNKGTVELR